MLKEKTWDNLLASDWGVLILILMEHAQRVDSLSASLSG